MTLSEDQPSLRDGDVLITLDEHRPSYYTLSQTPAGGQMSWPSRAGAERAALRFGRRHGVDVWLDEHGTLVQLAANPRATST